MELAAETSVTGPHHTNREEVKKECSQVTIKIAMKGGISFLLSFFHYK
jgi:hypothetical protein